MNAVPTLRTRRIWIVVNLFSLTLAVVLTSIGENFGWNWGLGRVVILTLLTYLLSLYISQGRTGLWSFVHKKVESLDEREQEQAYEALRQSYAIFSITALIALALMAMTEDSSVMQLFTWLNGRPLFVGMVLFAHSLPAVVIGWRKSNVLDEEGEPLV